MSNELGPVGVTGPSPLTLIPEMTMDFHYQADVPPGPLMTRLIDALKDSQRRVRLTVNLFEKGAFGEGPQAIEDAVNSPNLLTPSEREDVRKAITPE